MTDYTQKLQEEKNTLLGELSRLGKRNADNNEWEATAQTADPAEADPNSNADRFEDFEEKSALITPLEARLSQVENALAKIESGTYGTCRVCNAAIEDQRLAANPAAETCMTHLES